MKKLLIMGLLLAGCAGPVTTETVPDMATGYLCELLDPNMYLISDAERRLVHSELEGRAAECLRRAPVSAAYIPPLQPTPMPYFPRMHGGATPAPMFQTTRCNPTYGGGVQCMTF